MVRRRIGYRNKRAGIESLERRQLLAAVTWTAGGDAVSWGDGANWSTGAMPTAADDVTIRNQTTPIRLNGVTADVDKIDSTAALTIDSGSLHATGDMILHAPLNITGGTFTYDGYAQLYGSIQWSSGDFLGNGSATIFGTSNISTASNAGDLHMGSGLRLDFNAFVYITGGTAGQGLVGMGSGTQLSLNDSDFLFLRGNARMKAAPGARPLLYMPGPTSIRQLDATASVIDWKYYGLGWIALADNSSLTFTGGGNYYQGGSTTDFVVGANARLKFAGAFVTSLRGMRGTGTIEFAGGTNSLTNFYETLTPKFVLSAGTFRANSPLSLDRLSIAGGTFDSNNQTVTINTQFTWTGGTLGGTGTTIVAGAGSIATPTTSGPLVVDTSHTLRIASGVQLELTPGNGTLMNRGTIALAPGSTLAVTGSVINGDAAASGTIRSEINDLSAGKLQITGTLTLESPFSNHLVAALAAAASPATGQVFTPIEATGGIIGAFDAFESATTAMGASVLLSRQGTTTLRFTLADGVFPPPQVLQSVFEFETREAVSVRFDQDISALLARNDFELKNLTTGQTIPLSNGNIGFDPKTRTATLSLTSKLPDGNYRLAIAADDIANGAGQPMTQPLTLDFFVLAGDANRDRQVNFADLIVLASNYLAPGRTFSQGNFNYDPGGLVDFSDLVLLASRYNTTLQPPTEPGRHLPSPRRTRDSIGDQILK